MTRLELTDDGAFNLPRPGAPQIDNLIATLLREGNRATINLDRIAVYQGHDPATFRARFAHLETAWDAHRSAVSMEPDNAFDCEGK